MDPDETGQDFSGYDEHGQAMYRNTDGGAQCTRCNGMGGDHETGCMNAEA